MTNNLVLSSRSGLRNSLDGRILCDILCMYFFHLDSNSWCSVALCISRSTRLEEAKCTFLHRFSFGFCWDRGIGFVFPWLFGCQGTVHKNPATLLYFFCTSIPCYKRWTLSLARIESKCLGSERINLCIHIFSLTEFPFSLQDLILLYSFASVEWCSFAFIKVFWFANCSLSNLPHYSLPYFWRN